MTPAKLVQHLKQVPPKHLQIITLAWELVGPDGPDSIGVDPERARFRIEDLMLAKAEATTYAQATLRMREALYRCLQPDP